MLFNSYIFAVFFVIVYGLYWFQRRNHRTQNLLLFAASYVFYGWWDVRFLFLIALSTYVDYCMSMLIDRRRLTPIQKMKAGAFLVSCAFLFVSLRWSEWNASQGNMQLLFPISLPGWWCVGIAFSVVIGVALAERLLSGFSEQQARKICVLLSVLTNLVVLGVFKYFNFFADNFAILWSGMFGSQPGFVTMRIVLPVGISFFTFQTMSHTIDVFRKRIPATDSIIELGTYVAFFPQLVAGPIERGAHLLPQFQQPRSVTWEQCREGMWLIFWGLYKKVVIADNVALIVNGVFGPYDSLKVTTVPEDGLRCLIAIYAFAIQIYCDFSGYSDMARGTARLLGFDIMLNFNLPYFAVSPSDFWRRWHISLSTWLRDYLYIPLGGNRRGSCFMYRNLIITMVLGGLWHGAAWTFILWGLFHGLILVAYRLCGDRAEEPTLSSTNIVKAVLMFHLVCLGWLLFRAQNLTTVGLFLQAIVSRVHISSEACASFGQLLYYSWFLILFQVVQGIMRDLNPLRRASWFIRLSVWVFLIISLFRLARLGGGEQFIYFAF